MTTLDLHEPGRARRLAAAVGCSYENWGDTPLLRLWIDDIIDNADEAVAEAVERDAVHDTKETMHEPWKLVPQVASHRPEDAWQAVASLHAWKAVDWDVVAIPQNRTDLAADMLTYVGTQMAARAVQEALARHQGDTAEDTEEDE